MQEAGSQIVSEVVPVTDPDGLLQAPPQYPAPALQGLEARRTTAQRAKRSSRRSDYPAPDPPKRSLLHLPCMPVTTAGAVPGDYVGTVAGTIWEPAQRLGTGRGLSGNRRERSELCGDYVGTATDTVWELGRGTHRFAGIAGPSRKLGLEPDGA